MLFNEMDPWIFGVWYIAQSYQDWRNDKDENYSALMGHGM